MSIRFKNPPDLRLSSLKNRFIGKMGREMRELVPEGVGNFILKSFHEVKQMAEKQTGSEEGGGNFIVEKFHQFFILLQNAAMFLAEKLEHVLPPGARSEALHHWLVVGFLVLFAAVILVITVPILVCLLKCLFVCLINLIMGVLAVIFTGLAWICSCFVRVITGLFHGVVVLLKRCFPCFFSSAERMMRAPGRPGVWIPRSTFESNPAGYFKVLHAEV